MKTKPATCHACGSQLITCGPAPQGGAQITCHACGSTRHVAARIVPASPGQIRQMRREARRGC